MKLIPTFYVLFAKKESSLTCLMVRLYMSLVGFMFKDTKLFNIKIPYFGTLKKFGAFYVRKEVHQTRRCLYQ
jgi:hypothetical protein